MAQNSLVNSTTGTTPFECILSYQPPIMPWTGVITKVPAVDSWMKRSEEVWESTHQHIERILNRYKNFADCHRSDTLLYQPGDQVWLSTRDFRSEGGCRKLTPKYIGPFKVMERVNVVTYKLDLPKKYKVSWSFHVSLLKPVVPGPLDEVIPGGAPPSPVVVDGVPVYEVRGLLDSRRWRGQLQYLVDWEGYGLEERIWVPAHDALDPALVMEFHHLHLDKPAPRPRGRPRSQPLGAGRAPTARRSGGHPGRSSSVQHLVDSGTIRPPLLQTTSADLRYVHPGEDITVDNELSWFHQSSEEMKMLISAKRGNVNKVFSSL
ncbi:uncharacterized protein [Hoplias malabaricus]|uniref:uncharacterized protein n=1 Tax=Hoplias malabaricus TaxID=27720 RepID=UPI0034624B74